MRPNSPDDPYKTRASQAEALRRMAMQVFAGSRTEDISARLESVTIPAHTDARQPETGLVMVRGRIGGDGSPFNLGEATVSRAAVRLESGEVGFGYVLGRDRTKARLIALCDALMQTANHRCAVEKNVLAPLRAQVAAARKVERGRTAATHVDFFTLVRGED